MTLTLTLTLTLALALALALTLTLTQEALVLCEQLGTTFIKLGQALSIREDLIPTAYALELRQLQDAVPPFSSVEAFAVLREQLGVRDLNEVVSSTLTLTLTLPLTLTLTLTLTLSLPPMPGVRFP